MRNLDTVPKIRYWRDAADEAEIISCEDSSISYPLHSHVSMLVFGLVQRGEIALTLGGRTKKYRAGQAFLILPYAPHAIAADKPYSLLTLCLKKSLLPRLGREKFFSPLVNAAKERLERCPEGKWRVESLARESFSSQYHFIRQFKREIGLSPHQFQIQNRVRKAGRLIARGKSQIEAALAAGFCDQSHFIRLFERYVGLTPAAYKKACQII